MNASDVTDRFGKEFAVGDKVLFTTNDRGGGINYGEVIDIYEAQPQYWSHKQIKVKVRNLNDDGTPLMRFETYLDPTTNEFKRRETHRPVRASTLEYSPGKFVVFN